MQKRKSKKYLARCETVVVPECDAWMIHGAIAPTSGS